jgi:hypothetical protein
MQVAGVEEESCDLLIILLFNDFVSTSVVSCNIESLEDARVYPKVSGLAAWSENCKWYSSLPLGAVVSLFCESV